MNNLSQSKQDQATPEDYRQILSYFRVCLTMLETCAPPRTAAAARRIQRSLSCLEKPLDVAINSQEKEQHV